MKFLCFGKIYSFLSFFYSSLYLSMLAWFQIKKKVWLLADLLVLIIDYSFDHL